MTLHERIDQMPKTLNAQATLDLRLVADCTRWLAEHEIHISRISELVRTVLVVFADSAVKKRFEKTEDAIEYLQKAGYNLRSLRDQDGRMKASLLKQLQNEELAFTVSGNSLADAEEILDRAFGEHINTSEEG